MCALGPIFWVLAIRNLAHDSLQESSGTVLPTIVFGLSAWQSGCVWTAICLLYVQVSSEPQASAQHGASDHSTMPGLVQAATCALRNRPESSYPILLDTRSRSRRTRSSWRQRAWANLAQPVPHRSFEPGKHRHIRSAKRPSQQHSCGRAPAIRVRHRI